MTNQVFLHNAAGCSLCRPGVLALLAASWWALVRAAGCCGPHVAGCRTLLAAVVSVVCAAVLLAEVVWERMNTERGGSLGVYVNTHTKL